MALRSEPGAREDSTSCAAGPCGMGWDGVAMGMGGVGAARHVCCAAGGPWGSVWLRGRWKQALRRRRDGRAHGRWRMSGLARHHSVAEGSPTRPEEAVHGGMALERFPYRPGITASRTVLIVTTAPKTTRRWYGAGLASLLNRLEFAGQQRAFVEHPGPQPRLRRDPHPLPSTLLVQTLNTHP